MHVLPDVPSVRERAATVLATALRDAAQAAIVRAFTAYAAGEGGGPTNEEIHQFARLAIDEQRLRRRLAHLHVPLFTGSCDSPAAEESKSVIAPGAFR